jgi:general secretion pathway protein G
MNAVKQTGQRPARRPRSARWGFTLVEVVLLAAILAALCLAAVPVYTSHRDKARNAKAAADIAMLQFDLQFYASANNGKFPATLTALGRGTIRDPWGNPYGYLDIGTNKGHAGIRKDRFLVPLNTDYDLYSMGKDGQSKAPLTAQQSRDDIVRANNGGFIGLASDF